MEKLNLTHKNLLQGVAAGKNGSLLFFSSSIIPLYLELLTFLRKGHLAPNGLERAVDGPPALWPLTPTDDLGKPVQKPGK